MKPPSHGYLGKFDRYRLYTARINVGDVTEHGRAVAVWIAGGGGPRRDGTERKRGCHVWFKDA